MVIEVYSRTRSAATRRAILGTFALFALTLLLALLMSRQRAVHPRELRIEPAGWRISFEAPFERYVEAPARYGYAFTFFGRARDGTRLVLGIHRMEPEATNDARVICERAIVDHLRILRDLMGIPGRGPADVLGGVPLTWPDETLGPFPATQVWDPGVGAIARATIMPTGEAYAVTLLADRWLDQALYGLFETTCASIRRQIR